MTAIRNNTLPSAANAESAKAAAEALKKWVDNNRSLFDLLLDAYVVVDLSNQVVEFNEAFATLCGEPYRRISKTPDFCTLLKLEDCPHQCPAKQIITSERPLRLDEVSAASKNNPSLQIILGGIPIHDPKLGVVGTILTIRNVSAERELQKKYDERKTASITDGLTRIFNKVYTESALDRMVRIAAREDVPLSVVLCDIDHFKSVNDVFGHQAGDYVLAQIGQLLKSELRETDLAGRFGGEEFMAILYKSPIEGAKIFTERFRQKIEKFKFVFRGKNIPITLSFGTTTFKRKWEAGFESGEVSKELIRQADTALYLAKANGRNKTCQYELVKSSIERKKA